MKHAVSVSIGSSKRDKKVEIELLGETVQIERIGTDGDMEKAAQLYRQLDGKVDVFGVGGADLGLMIDRKWYPLYSVQSLVRYVQHTPVVDGCGLKTTLERRAAAFIDTTLGGVLRDKNVFVVAGTDRWGMAHGFAECGYRCTYGDVMFTLGLPFPLYKESTLKRAASLLMPVMGRIPFEWLYPTGKEQEKRTPKWGTYFQRATIIAGDTHYITRYMPDELPGKIIVTNTTTPEDKELFRRAGVKYLITTTPVLDGRSFGTNMMEAAILAATGWTQPVNYARLDHYLEHLDQLIDQLKLKPQLQELN